MDDQSDSTYSNILLENIDSDIPIALNFTTSPKITLTKDSQAANKLSTKKSSLIISGTERYIDDKYVTANLKQELLWEILPHFHHYNVVAVAMWENT